ncbi:MAG: galactose-binding like protein [Lasallia pustulata]|uniref:Galactose-binding like protein n=1 Tax=Lasallia pustulata TaxID=136370 RepID=A0A5M8PRP9_9LECA|nr:MAG: galactose-binding like protein [Lasallia pustulata]
MPDPAALSATAAAARSRASETAAAPSAAALLPPSSSPASSSGDAAVSTNNPQARPHLREISPLASWTVSTSKPGCGIPALLSPSPSQFWQSDGPQPHLLTAHFFKLVRIVQIRVYLDFELDESYTPTRMVFLAGMGMYDLTEFGEWVGEGPRGGWRWGWGGGGEAEAGNVLRAMVLQVRVCENHQNGKDTHVRGVQVFARDERGRGRAGGLGGRGGGGAKVDAGEGEEGVRRVMQGRGGGGGLVEAEWMGEPELR